MTEIFEAYKRGEKYRLTQNNFAEARRNRDFYVGRQWPRHNDGLPHPVFNLTRRIADYLTGAVTPKSYAVRLTDGSLPFKAEREAAADALKTLEAYLSTLTESPAFDEAFTSAVFDAVLTGNGALLVGWNAAYDDGQAYRGRPTVRRLDSQSVFFADVTDGDVEKQAYVLTVAKMPTAAVLEMAVKDGVSRRERDKIRPDADFEQKEKTGADYTTVVFKFFKSNGHVFVTWATEEVVGKTRATGLDRYPIVWLTFHPDTESYLGVSPITEVTENQRVINLAYALAVKHMRDTAFSKVIYDKTRIAEWNNRPGEAIAVIGSTDVNDAVSVLPVGQMQEGYLELIDRLIEQTKATAGAVDLNLGEGDAENKGAIEALQKAADRSLYRLKAETARAFASVATVLALTVLAAVPDNRPLPVGDGSAKCARLSLVNGKTVTGRGGNE